MDRLDQGKREKLALGNECPLSLHFAMKEG